MPELSAENIDLISREIAKQEISFSHLLDELIDHVCCDVENEMLSGLSFQQAYENVRLKFTPDCFREVQKDTLYAVDLKYRNMRNTMKISAVAGTILLGFAALFKIQHWPLAGILLTVGAFITGLVFLPSALGVLWKETHNKGRIFLFLAAFLTGFFFVAGSLFKVQHWPMAGLFLTFAVFSAAFLLVPSLLIVYMKNPEKKQMRGVYLAGSAGFVMYVAGLLFRIQHWPLAMLFSITGIILLVGITLPWYCVKTWKNEIQVSSRFLFMIIALILILVPVALINLNVQYSYEDGYYPNQFRQVALTNYLVKRTSSVIDTTSDPVKAARIAEIHSEAEKLLGTVGKIQHKLVLTSEGEGKPSVDLLRQTETGININYYFLSRPFLNMPFGDFQPGSEIRSELETDMSNYVAVLSKYLPEQKIREFRDLLDIMNFLPETSSQGESVMAGLHSLEILRNCILATESGAMNFVLK